MKIIKRGIALVQILLSTTTGKSILATILTEDLPKFTATAQIVKVNIEKIPDTQRSHWVFAELSSGVEFSLHIDKFEDISGDNIWEQMAVDGLISGINPSTLGLAIKAKEKVKQAIREYDETMKTLGLLTRYMGYEEADIYCYLMSGVRPEIIKWESF